MSSDGKKPSKGLGAVAGRMRSMFRRGDATGDRSAESDVNSVEDETTGARAGMGGQADAVIGTTEDPSQAPLMEHLRELRLRVFIYIIVFFVLTLGAFFLAKPIYLFLAEPIIAVFERNGLPTVFIVTSPFEKFFADFSLAIFVGFAVTLPVLLFQIWRFVAPGLYSNEKGAMRPFLIASPVLFAVGLAFVYFVVMPMAFTFLIGYALNGGEFNMSRSEAEFQAVLETYRAATATFLSMDPAEAGRDAFVAAGEAYRSALRDMAQLRPLDKVSIDPQTKIADYLRDSMRMLIGGGLGFQLPVALTLMVRSGLISTRFLRRNRKFAVLILFIISGVLTPPDIISQAMLGGPMYLLYEAAIFIGQRIEAYQRANNPYWASDDDDENFDDEPDEGENQIFDPNADDDALAMRASADEPESGKPKILKSTPKPSGDEGLLKPDLDDD
ncbi:MAG: hypothetical protein CMF26_03190 [Kiloniella sp.]|nr:hypothetical protein [Kiloniella sp.]